MRKEAGSSGVERELSVRGSQKKPPARKPDNAHAMHAEHKLQKTQKTPKLHLARPLGWEDVDNPGADVSPATKALTRSQAQALRAKDSPVSPWRVVGTQAVLGVVLALFVALFTDRNDWSWSVLYGAATVVMPGALMAWGISRPLSRTSAGARVASFFVWEAVKVGISVVMLLLAPLLVQPLSWPALLVGLVLCLKCYWVALRWRGLKKN